MGRGRDIVKILKEAVKARYGYRFWRTMISTALQVYGSCRGGGSTKKRYYLLRKYQDAYNPGG